MTERAITTVLGATLPLTVSFYNDAGQLADPTTVTLVIQRPSGADLTYTLAAAEITRTGVGQYEKAITFDQVENWALRWVATGAVQAVVERRVYVAPSLVV
jgi:hypothetical protein